MTEAKAGAATAPHTLFKSKHDRITIKGGTSLVFLDANVLLAPYQTSTAVLGEIKRVFRVLRDEKRLVVPEQAAQEFARNRLACLSRLYKRVRDQRAAGLEKYEAEPVLHALKEHKVAVQASEAVQAALKSYRRALDELMTEIAGWQSHDPVLDAYQDLFDNSVVRALLTAETLEEQRKTRYAARIPPGYKDASKDDGGVGDLAIWLTIIEVAKQEKREAVVVTEETKADWFHRIDKNELPLFLRAEMVQEFERETQQTITHTTLSSLLSAYDATPEIVEEVERVVPIVSATTASFYGGSTESSMGAFIRGGAGALGDDLYCANCGVITVARLKRCSGCRRYLCDSCYWGGIVWTATLGTDDRCSRCRTLPVGGAGVAGIQGPGIGGSSAAK